MSSPVLKAAAKWAGRKIKVENPVMDLDGDE